MAVFHIYSNRGTREVQFMVTGKYESLHQTLLVMNFFGFHNRLEIS